MKLELARVRTVSGHVGFYFLSLFVKFEERFIFALAADESDYLNPTPDINRKFTLNLDTIESIEWLNKQAEIKD